MSKTIYKICEWALWELAERAGAFAGSAVDLRDGFIHFSTAAQLRRTAARHFAGAESLLLIAVNADALGAALKWEASRGDEAFPHLHGVLPVSAVVWTKALPVGTDGQHIFPEPLA
jgi:uncharacterized protein (DUF952 family)